MTFQGSLNDSDPQNVLTFQMLGAFAEFERQVIKRRQREGVEIAKAEGRYKGGTKTIDRSAVRDLHCNGLSPTQIARTLKISRSTVYGILRELGLRKTCAISGASNHARA